MTSSITWPVDLPQAVLVNNSYQQNFNVIRSTVGVGPAKTRKRSTAAIREYDCTLILRSLAQRNRFDQFVDSDTSGGADSFNWKDPQTGDSAELRFVSIGKITHMGNYVFQVDFVLEKLP